MLPGALAGRGKRGSKPASGRRHRWKLDPGSADCLIYFKIKQMAAAGVCLSSAPSRARGQEPRGSCARNFSMTLVVKPPLPSLLNLSLTTHMSAAARAFSARPGCSRLAGPPFVSLPPPLSLSSCLALALAPCVSRFLDPSGCPHRSRSQGTFPRLPRGSRFPPAAPSPRCRHVGEQPSFVATQRPPGCPLCETLWLGTPGPDPKILEETSPPRSSGPAPARGTEARRPAAVPAGRRVAWAPLRSPLCGRVAGEASWGPPAGFMLPHTVCPPPKRPVNMPTYIPPLPQRD